MRDDGVGASDPFLFALRHVKNGHRCGVGQLFVRGLLEDETSNLLGLLEGDVNVEHLGSGGLGSETLGVTLEVEPLVVGGIHELSGLDALDLASAVLVHGDDLGEHTSRELDSRLHDNIEAASTVLAFHTCAEKENLAHCFELLDGKRMHLGNRVVGANVGLDGLAAVVAQNFVGFSPVLKIEALDVITVSAVLLDENLAVLGGRALEGKEPVMA
jgi:hypothetical protein